MSEFNKNLNVYWKYNKNLLTTYVIISYILLVVLYVISRFDDYNLDIPLAWGYLLVTPSILGFLTFRKVDLQFYYTVNGRSWWPLVFSMAIPLIIAIVPVFLYTGFVFYHEDGGFDFNLALQSLVIAAVAIPFQLYTFIVALDRKYKLMSVKKNQILGFAFLGDILIFAIINLLVQSEQAREVIGIIFVLTAFVIFPIYTVINGYREVDA